jgi:hypothetical protein
MPRHRLTDKIYNTNMQNNTERWLVHYLAGRQGDITLNNKSSRTRNFTNGVPQGSVLYPTLFNLYMHDIAAPPPNIYIASYTDAITIIFTHTPAQNMTSIQV